MSSRWNNERIRNWSMLPGLQHFGVEGRAKALRRDYDEWQACQLFTRTYINQTSWLVHSWNIFDARISHRQTQTHKTHHGLDLGEATTFPFIILSMLGHGACTQMSFCPGTPKLGILKFLELGFSRLWRPITSCAYLQLKWGLKQSCILHWELFKRYVARHLHASKYGWFLIFNGQESNW